MCRLPQEKPKTRFGDPGSKPIFRQSPAIIDSPHHIFINARDDRSMAEKKRLRMRGVKQASKREEEDILGRSAELAANPGILRPMCAGNCRKCVFDKVFKDIGKAASHRGDEKTLLKLADRGGDNLARAYAGTISVDAAGKIPLLATAVIAGDRIPYVVRGSVRANFLIGCQHYDDPKLRLLYYNELIRDEKLHLYSWDENVVCSDKPNMPEDYLYSTWWESPYNFPGDGIGCGHDGAVSLNITVKSLGETVHICADCAKSVSTLAFLVSRLCSADPLDDFRVFVKHAYHSAGESGEEEITGSDLKDYMVGKITDRGLVDKVRAEKLGALTGNSGLILLIGEKNYGSDTAAFLKDVEGDEKQKKLVEDFLSANPGAVISRSPRITDVLSALWDRDWHLLVEVATDKEFAAAQYSGERPKQPVVEVLTKAHRDYISQDVVKNLPEFFKPGQSTRVADALAKAAKVGGLVMMADELTRCTLKDSKSKSIAESMFLAMDRDAKTGLTMSKEEREFAQFLVPFAKNVIDAEGEKYREQMNTLLMAACVSEKV